LNSVNLSDVFVGMAARWQHRPAIISENLNLSYAELVIRAAQSARELRARDIGAGINVGIALRDNAESLVFMIALWMLGATAVPMDFRTTAAERNLLAQEFDLAAIIVDRDFQASGYAPISIGDSWTDDIARHEGRPVHTSEHQQAVPAFISLTSGTTGRAKGIVIGHERMLLRSMFDAEQIEGPLLNPLPLSFSASRTHVFSALLQGASVNFYPLLFSTQQLADSILAGEVKSLCAVPTIIRNLFELFGEPSTPALATLGAIYCFGAPMSAEEKLRAKRFLCDHFVQVYGASICGRISTLSGADLEARPDSVGRVLPHITLQLVDADDNPVPSGEAGMIRLRSPGMAQCIYGGGEPGSGDSFKAGWAYPGDIGALDDGGILHLLGRGSDLIIRGGVNVHPSEVETAIAELAGVREVAVVGFTKLPEGQEIAAFVVGDDVTEAALVAHCRVRLNPDKRPRRFLLVKDLPRNVNGKINRAELRQQLEATS
jgi:long-chain acyl-CoA synthetase